MKNIKTYGSFIIIALVLVLIATVSSISRNNNTGSNLAQPQTSSTVGQQADNARSAVAVPATNRTSGKTTVSPAQSSSFNSYETYLTQQANSQNNCKSLASSQYDDMYLDSLGQSSFQSYYNSTTGLCYMKVVGGTPSVYMATSTAVIYFRSVSHDSLIAECTDNTGVTFADSEWSCTDKTTGQSITKAQLNALIYKYTAQ